MLLETKQLKPDFYKLIHNILGMDFFKVCKDSVLKEEELYLVLLQCIWCLEQEEKSLDKLTNVDVEGWNQYEKTLCEEFPLELQLNLYYAVDLLAEAFRDEEEAALLTKENIPMVTRAASLMEEYEEANGKDFYEYVCEFLEEEKDIFTILEDMTEYFGMDYEEKIEEPIWEYALTRLQEDGELFLPDRFFERRTSNPPSLNA